MKKWLRGSIAIAAGALWFAAPANAIPITSTVSGLTYNIEATSLSATVERFAIVITGINGAVDISKEGGGRTGIHAVAITDNAVTGGIMQATLFNSTPTFVPTGYTLSGTGLNSGGCNMSGANFVCFQAPTSPPGTLMTDKAILVFDLTSAAGWANYNVAALKIDWTGSKNNYDLLSKDITIDKGTCPDCTINPVDVVPTPEPASMALLGAGLLGLGGVMRRRRS